MKGNKSPDTSGIDRYWKEGEDDRVGIRALCGEKKETVDSVLTALQTIVFSRRRTKIVGFGVFSWMPWKRRVPTGNVVETWHLAFKPSRYSEKYKGE